MCKPLFYQLCSMIEAFTSGPLLFNKLEYAEKCHQSLATDRLRRTKPFTVVYEPCAAQFITNEYVSFRAGQQRHSEGSSVTIVYYRSPLATLYCFCLLLDTILVGQRWNTRCDMLNVTHRYVFVSQQVCRHQSFSVWTRAWPRLIDDNSVWKHVGRDKTWENRWQVTYRHVLLCETLHRTRPCKSNVLFRGTSFYI